MARPVPDHLYTVTLRLSVAAAIAFYAQTFAAEGIGERSPLTAAS
jgi:hypothetical protein